MVLKILLITSSFTAQKSNFIFPMYSTRFSQSIDYKFVEIGFVIELIWIFEVWLKICPKKSENEKTCYVADSIYPRLIRLSINVLIH